MDTGQSARHTLGWDKPHSCSYTRSSTNNLSCYIYYNSRRRAARGTDSGWEGLRPRLAILSIFQLGTSDERAALTLRADEGTLCRGCGIEGDAGSGAALVGLI